MYPQCHVEQDLRIQLKNTYLCVRRSDEQLLNFQVVLFLFPSYQIFRKLSS